MRITASGRATFALLALSLPGCVHSPEASPLEAVLGETASSGTRLTASIDSQVAGEDLSEPDVAARHNGQLGDGDVALFDLGSGVAGDEWSIKPANGAVRTPLIVVLLDQADNMLARERIGIGGELRHILRDDARALRLGVMPMYNSSGGSFGLDVAGRYGGPAPAAREQVVWLNFGPGHGVSVNGRSAVAFSSFDAARIDGRYAADSERMKALIVETLRLDYAAYNIQFVTSDQEAPAGDYSVVHFGGEQAGLLGLADSVDNYNQHLDQQAIVFTDEFAPYVSMELSTEEMAAMVANVASHELGHLLGLYHTRDPADVMDTTGSARDLTTNQAFSRAALEPSVFAIGYSDSPALLRQTLGPNPNPPAAPTAKTLRHSSIRGFAQEELCVRCGTCRDFWEN